VAPGEGLPGSTRFSSNGTQATPGTDFKGQSRKNKTKKKLGFVSPQKTQQAKKRIRMGGGYEGVQRVLGIKKILFNHVGKKQKKGT